MPDLPTPLRVWGAERSYFTGKLEAYLRYKEIPYERISAKGRDFGGTLPARTGAMQIPAVELPDGRWLTDTTPIIAWLEGQWEGPAVIPEDPAQAFLSRLIEDYGDEWLWRPAMHYRWSYAASRAEAGANLARELLADIPLPVAIKRHFLSLRQLTIFVWGDGVTRFTWAHVEQGYFRALEHLASILEKRHFLLGERPSLADIGYFGSMWRHFGIDATPASIMREQAPNVYEWLGRLWNARASELNGSLLDGVPADWGPILDEIAGTHLEQLAANAAAWTKDEKQYEMVCQGTRYERVPTSRYRVWCLEEQRRNFEELPDPAREEVRALLERHGCWEPLWRVEARSSGHDPEREAPFCRGTRVFRATRIQPRWLR
jgi:glutathione S-transferase